MWRLAARNGAAAVVAAALLGLGAQGALADPDEPLPMAREPRWDRAVGDPDGAPPTLRRGASDVELSRADERLAEAVREALRSEPALRLLTVRARDGVVVLEGRVDRAAQRTAAAVTASSVEGVRELRNRVEIRAGDDGPSGERPDAPAAAHPDAAGSGSGDR